MSSTQRADKIELYIVVLLTIAVRVAVGFFTGRIFHPQVYEYEELARNILQGKGYVGVLDGNIYYSMMYPLYPYLNAAVYYITDYSQAAMIGVQIGISGLSSLLVVLIGRYLMKSPGPFIAGIIAAFHPALIVYSSFKIHEINLVIFFILLNIYLVFILLNNFSYRKVMCISLVFTAGIFTRITLAFFPFLLLIMLPGDINRKINVLFILVLFCCSFVLMWNYRNYKIHGRFVFSTMNAYNLYMGNNIDATGTEFTKDKKSIRSVIQEKNTILRTMGEGQRYDYFKKRAAEFILENPFRFIKLTIKRIYYFWWFSPYTGILYPKQYFVIYKIFYTCILSLAIVGIFDSRLYETEDQKRMFLIIMVTLIIICLAQSLVYVQYRHRASIELLLVLFVANGIGYLPRGMCGISKNIKRLYAKL